MKSWWKINMARNINILMIKICQKLLKKECKGDKPYGTTPITDVDDSKMTLTNFKLLLFLISLILIQLFKKIYKEPIKNLLNY